MQDSLEDFIKLTRNTKKEFNHVGKQELREKEFITLQRKKECESRAVKIVEFLIEGKLRPEVFIRCLKHINQSYYQDIVEERAISKLCGYCLCDKKIPDMPKKQYFINIKNNKVYDIRDRKNYCSNFCYKASIHIKEQIDNSPLWLRKLEDGPKFSLLSTTEKGSPGEEVNQGIATNSSVEFTSVSSFAAISLGEVNEMEIKSKKKKHRSHSNENMSQHLHTVTEIDEVSELDEISESPSGNDLGNDKNKILESDSNKTEDNKHNIIKNDSDAMSSLNNIETENLKPSDTNNSNNNNNMEQVSSSSAKSKVLHSNSSTKSKSKSKGDSTKHILANIKKNVLEWLTLESYIFLYGEEHIKEFLNEKQLEEYLQSLQLTEVTINQQKKYLEICRKLNLSQLAEDKFHQAVIGNTLKPVPNFKVLKEENKAHELKVYSFYEGMPYKMNEITENVKESNNKGTEESRNVEEGPPEVLPLIDKNSKIALRRKVFLNSINKAMMALMQNLGIPSQIVLEDLQSLVKTFRLESHNVVFKPVLWSLIALILLKMLSIRDSKLKTQLETKKSETFINLMLKHFTNAQSFMSELFVNIEDINSFLEHYFCEK